MKKHLARRGFLDKNGSSQNGHSKVTCFLFSQNVPKNDAFF
jgi:hypothetical protein